MLFAIAARWENQTSTIDAFSVAAGHGSLLECPSRLNCADDLSADLVRRAERAGKTAAEFIAEALRRQISIERFRETRERLASYGVSAGLQSDDEVFTAIS